MLELNGERFVVVYAGDVWEVSATPAGSIVFGEEEIPVPESWHLIRAQVTISIPKIAGESFAEFQKRLV